LLLSSFVPLREIFFCMMVAIIAAREENANISTSRRANFWQDRGMRTITCNRASRLCADDAAAAFVEPGEVVVVETLNAYGGRFASMTDLLALMRDKTTKHHPLTGPIEVRGARPGEVLQVAVRAIQPEEMGQSLSRSAGAEPLQMPLFGDRAPVIGTLQQRPGGAVEVEYGTLHLPCSPMLGIVGTAPASGHVRTGHGGPTGGNLDLPFVRPGCVVYLPVQREGAWLYLGDAHALQAYGELGGIALECSARVEIVVQRCLAEPGWFEPDPYIATHLETPPVVVAGEEPLSRCRGVGVVGVSPELGRLDRAVVEAYRAAVKFVWLITQRVSWGEARNLVTLLGHSLNGQAAALTAESTSMIFFRGDDLARLYRTSGDVVDEVLATVFPEVG
jgi:acetamidase/formamidase